MAEVQVIIRAIDKASATMSKVGSSMGGLTKGLKDFGLVAGTVVAAGYAVKKVFDATVGSVMAYNKSILDSARASGTSVEQFSRIVQVADDVGVSMGDVQTALQLATKNGFAPSVNSIADLADQLNAMESPTARAAAAAKIFGRNWAALDPLLQTGGEAIRANSAAVAAGLVVTDAEVAKTEKLRLQIDALNDSWKAATNTIGLEVVPMLSEDIDTVNKAAAAYTQLNDIVQYYLATNKDTTRIVMEAKLAHAGAAGAFQNYGSEAHGATEAIEKLKDASLEELKIAEAQAYLDQDRTKLAILEAEIALREGNNREIQATIAFLERIRANYDGKTWHVNVDVNTPEGFGITSGENPNTGGSTHQDWVDYWNGEGPRPPGTDPGSQHGGSYIVPGTGTGDRPYVLGLEPGERVDVTPRNMDNRNFTFNTSINGGSDGASLLSKIQGAVRRI